MNKRSFLFFAIFAALFAVFIPYLAISKEGEPSSSSEKVAAVDQDSKLLFQTNCGSCHVLARAGTDGVVGPNLDERLGDLGESNSARVLAAIQGKSVAGTMPAGILQGSQAEQVANFVARVAGQ